MKYAAKKRNLRNKGSKKHLSFTIKSWRIVHFSLICYSFNLVLSVPTELLAIALTLVMQKNG